VDGVTPDGPRRAPIRWHVATVRDARAESPSASTLVLDVHGWRGHVASQHVAFDGRLVDGPSGAGTRLAATIPLPRSDRSAIS
jgi:hypothetical protein